MGNRAAVVFTDKNHKEISPAVYLHWNGGPESVYAFLDELCRRGLKGGYHDYASARFVHVVCDFFDHDDGAGHSSVGLMSPPDAITPEALAGLANTADDNGVYVVSPGANGWNVRRFVLTKYDQPPRELTSKEVKDERGKAYKHEYNHNPAKPEDTIAGTFLKARPKINPYG